MNIDLKLKKSLLTARMRAMVEKQAQAPVGDDAPGSVAAKATDLPSDTMLVLSALRSAVDSLYIFILGEAFGVEDISDTLSDDGDEFKVSMEVSSRFNKVMVQPLTSVAGDYIVRHMLYQWYSAFATETAAVHYNALATIEDSISRCFRKKTNCSSVDSFPAAVRFDYVMPEIVEDGDTVFVPYVVEGDGDDVVNDVCLDHLPYQVVGTLFHNGVSLKFRDSGTFKVRIFSYHDTSVEDSLTFKVQPYA